MAWKIFSVEKSTIKCSFQQSTDLKNNNNNIKEMLYAVRCLKSNEDMILALAGQFKQLSHEPEKSR